MKLIFRFLVLTILAATFSIVAFAQDPCADTETINAAYNKFRTELYPKTALADRKSTVAFAKDFVEKYGKCTEDATKSYVTYFSTSYIPPTEEGIRKEESANEIAARRTRFNNAVKAANWDEVYASGKDLIANDPDAKVKLDVTIFLGSIGFDESVKGNDKYNDDTVKYAQDAIKSIESGATSTNYGYGRYSYKTDKYPDGKSNALGWLNYNIAYIKNDRQKDTKGALPYYYKVTQYTTASPSKNPVIFYNVAVNYDKALTDNETDRQNKIKAAGNKDTDETKTLFAMSKGYADRVLDAYARAYNLSTDPKDKAGRDAIYDHMKEIYAFRYQKGSVNPYASLDALILGVKTKPFIDPTTPITPVVEAAPDPATTTGATGAMTTTTTTTTTAPKPVTTTTAPKPATTTTMTTPKPAVTSTTPAKATPAKTTPKKKPGKK